jgi:phosphatidylglycerol:prolipoprotein diacylglycerol transferase
MYIGWYGLGRFFIEGLRTDSLYIGNIRASQLVAGICVVIAVVLIIVLRGKVKRMHGDYRFYFETEESVRLLKEADSKELKVADKKSNKKGEENAVDSESSNDEENAAETEPIDSESINGEENAVEIESSNGEENEIETENSDGESIIGEDDAAENESSNGEDNEIETENQTEKE